MKNNIELENLLNQWFQDNKNDLINKPHFWNRNKIANLIREYLVASGKWKNKKRGDSEKGWKKLQEKKRQEMEQKTVENLLDF